MTWTERIKSVFNRGVVDPPNPGQSLFWPQLWSADGTYFGPQEAMQLSVVWACISVISRSVATCDWKVYERKDGRLEYLEDDALDYLLNTRPNPEMTAMAVKEAIVLSATVWGNGYAEIVKDNAGRVKELWPLQSDRVEPIRIDAKGDRVASGGELAYLVTQPNGGMVVLRQSQVYHLRGPSLTGLTGENMVNRAAKTLVLSAAADAFATGYYRNNTVVGGVLEYPKAMDPASHKRLKDQWVETYSGPSQAYKPIILEQGMTWKPIGDNSAAASQMLQARAFQVEETARWFGVPLHMVGSLAGSQGYGTNLEQLGLGFVRDCLGPWAKRMEQEADWKFFPMRGSGAKKQTRLDLTPLTRGDSLTRANAYAVMRRIGVYSANDILRMEGQNGIGAEGDLRVIESSLSATSRLTEQKVPEIFQYHIENGIPSLNEVRERLGLPAVEGGEGPANQNNPAVQQAEAAAEAAEPPDPSNPEDPETEDDQVEEDTTTKSGTDAGTED